MKLELSIGGKVVIIESQGAVSVQVFDEAASAPVPAGSIVSQIREIWGVAAG
jgi:hypothetical protein